MIMKFRTIESFKKEFEKLTKDVTLISEFYLNSFSKIYIGNDFNIYTVTREDYFAGDDFAYDDDDSNFAITKYEYILEVCAVTDFLINLIDDNSKEYNKLLKERDFLFNKLDEVMPVYHNAGFTAEENEKLKKDLEVLKEENEKLKKDLEVLKEEKIKSVNEVLRLRVEISNLYKLLGVKWKDSMVYKELLEEEIARNKED